MVSREDGPDDHSPWTAVPVTILAFLTLYGSYLTALRLTVEAGSAPNERDGTYFGIHGIALVSAVVVGSVLGQVFGKRMFAVAVLFFAVMIVGMIAAQLVTFELACSGHNDLIRHWQC